MNEQNYNGMGSNPSVNNTPIQNNNPVETPSIMENINTIQPDAVPSVSQLTTPASQPVQTTIPAQAPAPVPTPQPTQTPVPTPIQTPAQPAQVVTPTPTVSSTPQPTPQPVEAPVQPTPGPTPQPVVQPTNLEATPTMGATTETAQTIQPTQPVEQTNQTINNAQGPTQLNGVGQSTPQATPTPEPNTIDVTNQTNTGTSTGNGTFGPSRPMSSDADLTNVGFVAASDSLPKKKSKLPLILAAVFVIVLGLVGYFVIYPYVLKTYFNDPKNVYETTINTSFKKINSSINEIVHEKAIYDIELGIDSNLEVLQPYSGYKYGVNFGIDPKKNNLQLGYSIKTPANLEYSAYSYIKDNKNYERYSTYRDTSGKIGLIYTGEADQQQVSELFSSFQQIINNYNKVNNEDLTYLTDKMAKILVDSIDESKLSKEDASITLNGETLKVTNNKYVLDLDNKRRTVKYIIDEIKNDSKTIEILSKMTDTSADDIKKALDINVDEIITGDDTLYVSIYTYGNKNEIIGYGLTDADQEFEFHYYSKDKNLFEAYIYTVSENDETGKREEDKIDIKGVNNADGHKITVTANGEDAIILDIKAWDENNKEFNYTIKSEDGDYTGTIKYNKELNDDRLKISFAFSIKVSNEENLSIDLTFTEDWSSEVSNINTSATGSVVTLTETELNDVRTKFNNELYNSTPLGTFFQTVSGMYSSGVNDYYSDNDATTPNDSNEITNGNTNTTPSVTPNATPNVTT